MLLSTLLSTSRHFLACFITEKSMVKATFPVNEMDFIWVIISINTFTLNRFYSYVTRNVWR